MNRTIVFIIELAVVIVICIVIKRIIAFVTDVFLIRLAVVIVVGSVLGFIWGFVTDRAPFWG
jgi:hypothetical protein